MLGERPPVRTEEDCDRAVAWLDRLLDDVSDAEAHPLFQVVEMLGTLTELTEQLLC